MKYVLRKADQSDELEMKISQEAYASYKESQTILNNCLAFEEKYGNLILAYLDLERQMFDATLSNMMYGLYDPLDVFDARLDLNLRLMSLLTAITLYRDRFPHHIKECIPHCIDADSLAKSLSPSLPFSRLNSRWARLLRI